MAINKNLQRLHMTLSIGASVIAIVSAVISVAAYWRTDAFQRLLEETRRVDLRLSITSPSEGSDHEGPMLPWTGKVEMRIPGSSQSPANATLELAERRIQIVPFVRPLSDNNLWWAQTVAATDGTGVLTGSINLGGSNGRGAGLAYHITLLAIAAGSVAQGDKFPDLPQHSSGSPVITVKRVQ